MGTAVLRSNDCLIGQFPRKTLVSYPSKQGRNPNKVRSSRRKRSSSEIHKIEEDRCSAKVVKFPAKNLVMGQVTILKRGEELKTPAKNLRSDEGGQENKADIQLEDSALFSTDRLDLEPEMVPNEILLAELSLNEVLFAGSSFISSPSPSSVPFPAFFNRNDGLKPRNNDAEASKDLCRLLHLDLT